MANKVLVLGKSGTGKSRAIKNLNPKETFIINPDEKGLPFKGWKSMYKTVLKEDGKVDMEKTNFYQTTSPQGVLKLLHYISESRKDIKVIVIDTITLMMVATFMDQAKIKGFDKFTNQALDVYQIFKSIDGLREDLTVFVLSHVEVDMDGNSDFFVVGGKLIREKANPVGMFTVVLETYVDFNEGKAQYYFSTQNNGKNVSKSPEGMFPEYRIDNDFAYVLESLNKYEN